MPKVNFLVITNLLPWDFCDLEFFDGYTSWGNRTTRPGKDFDWTSGGGEKVVIRDLAIHPIELLLADYYGWRECVLQVVHHELTHVLQQRFVQNFMVHLYLDEIINKQKKLVDRYNVEKNLSFIDDVIKDIDVRKLRDLVIQNETRFYIRETIPAELRGHKDLDKYVNSQGGHTQAFLDVMQNFQYCRIANIQRDFFYKFISHLSRRAYDASFGGGQVFLCKD